MSRCTVKTTTPGVHLEVGLDIPMQCYFGHAYDGDDSEPIDSLWRANNHQILLWMKSKNVDLKDTYTAAVYEAISGDFDPGDVVGRV